MENKIIVVAAIVAISVIATAQADNISKLIYPTTQVDGDFPEMFIMKGVATNNGTVKSAVFFGINKQNDTFKDNFLVIDGQTYKVGLIASYHDTDAKATVLSFGSNNGTLSLVLKIQKINGQDTLVGSGIFNGNVLNLKTVSGTPAYNEFQNTTNQPANSGGGNTDDDIAGKKLARP